jgi:PAS domain S-box-containing protein
VLDRQHIQRASVEEVLHQMPAGVVIVEAPSGKILFVNRQTQQWAEEYLGQSVSSELAYLRDLHDVDENGISKIRHPDGRPYEMEEWPLMRSIRDGEEVRDWEYFYTLADGSHLWLRANSSPIYDEEGRIVAGVLVTHDITEPKMAEEKLREREERFRATFEQAAVGIAHTALDGRWLRVNQKLCDILGYTREELLQKTFQEITHSDDLEPNLEYRRQLLTGEKGSFSMEKRYVRKDGSIVWGNLTASLGREPSGEPGYIIHVIEDITERKRVEKEREMRANQQAVVAELGLWALGNNDLQALMEDATASVARTLDVEYCKIVELLPGGKKLMLRAGFGWERDLVGGSTEDADLDSQAGYTLLSSEPVIVEDLNAETRFIPPPLLREHGVVSGLTVVIAGREGPFGVLGAHTRSLRAFSEDDVNFLQAVANVLAMAIERKEAQEKLEQVREAERSRIARDLHDEALQDLAQAKWQAQLAQTKLQEPELAGRMSRLSAALGRVEYQVRTAIYDLRLKEEQDRPFAVLLESLVELHRTMAPDCDIRLDIGGGILSGPLGTTGTELLRIMGEALTNARRHSGARNVGVTVRASEEMLWAEVSDDGRGFDPAEQPYTVTGGMGTRDLRERTRALGGVLKIESQPGKGTKVRFELALARDSEVPEEEVREDEVREDEVRILLVEDHATVREAIASTLEREAGFEIVGQAGSIAEARSMLSARPVDVAIIDLGLPDGYGADLIPELREVSPQSQALVLSVTLDRAKMARAVQSGAAGILNKSAPLDQVVEAVRRLMRGETLLPMEEVVELLRFASSRREEEYDTRQALARLTSREIEVLQHLANGLDSEEIAQRLHIALRTERNHVSHILTKLGVHSQQQALVLALRYGVVKIS